MKNIQRHRYKDKKIFETRTLTFDPYPYSEIDQVIGLIQDNLTPDLLKGKKVLMYPNDVQTNRFYGHCYHASQALYYLMDTTELVPMSGEDYRGEKHWWLQDGEKVYDCTAGQYLDIGETPPKITAKKEVWYGWKQPPKQTKGKLLKK